MRKEYDPILNERNCKMFLKFIDNGKGEEAYKMLKENPNLVDELKLCDISNCYQEIIRSVGDKAAYYFLELLKERHQF